VDYYQGSGANIFVYYNDGTAIDGSLVDNTLVMYHPTGPAGVWNMAFIDGYDHNVYLTATKTGVMYAASTARAVQSAARHTSAYDCFMVEAAGGVVGGIIGKIAGMEIGADVGAAVGISVGPEGAVFGAIIGGTVGVRYGDIIGVGVGSVVAHYLCHAFTDKNPPNPPNNPPGTGGGVSGTPPTNPTDDCWLDPAPPDCYRRQAPIPM